MLLGIPLGRYGRFRLRDSYPLWCAFPCASTNPVLCHSLTGRQSDLNGPTTPNTQRLPAITRARFSLFRFRSPLLAESRLLSLPVGTEMFHFPTFPPHALCVQARVTPHDWCGVPPFGHPRINARLAAPRGLTQPPTSFIGSWCPGIHRVPLTTWPHNYNKPHTLRVRASQSKKMLASTVQFSTYNRPPSGTAPANPTPRAPPTGGTQTSGWYEDPDGPDTRQPTPPTARTRMHPARGVRSLRTQQRAYDHQPPTTPLHTPPQGGRRTGGSTGYRPNWSAFHPRAPPHTLRRHPRLGTDHDVGAALDTPADDPQVGQEAKCSLERR